MFSSKYKNLTLFFMLLLCGLISVQVAASTSSWLPADFSMVMGDGVATKDGLAVNPDDNGKVYITMLPKHTMLDEQVLLKLDFAGSPPPVIFLIWRNNQQPKQVYQYRLPKPAGNQVLFDMTGVKGWTGQAIEMGIGLGMHREGRAIFKKMSLSRPTVFTRAQALWRNWAHFRSWIPSDINVYGGTRDFGVGPHPAPVFAGLALILFSGGCLFGYFKTGTWSISWRLAGAMVLLSWILLDGFWQYRLVRQATLTYQQFHGKTAQEKLLASEDSPWIHFADAAREKISHKDARVFIASSSDALGMLSAYYMSPLNTYWHRRGPELPQREYLRAGDYILLVAPTSVAYDPKAEVVNWGDTGSLSVEQVYAGAKGVLLKVIP